MELPEQTAGWTMWLACSRQLNYHPCRCNPDCGVPLPPSHTKPVLHYERAGILIVTGEHDIGSNPRMARFMADFIPGAVLRVLPGLHHSILLEVPHQFAGLLSAFFAGRELPPEASRWAENRPNLGHTAENPRYKNAFLFEAAPLRCLGLRHNKNHGHTKR